MGFMFCDLHVTLNNHSSGDINSSSLPCFLIISCGSFQHLTNFLNRCKNNTCPKYLAKKVVIFIQLLCFI